MALRKLYHIKRKWPGQAGMAERNRPGAAQPDLVVDVGRVEQRGKPLLPGREPVLARRQGGPRRLPPAGQPSAVIDPRHRVRLGEESEEVSGITDSDRAGEQPFRPRTARHRHAAIRVT